MKKILSLLLSVLPLAASAPPQPEFKAIIFDCDGVLVDTEYLKFLAWQEALAACSVDFTLEDYMPLVGHSTANILRMIASAKQCALSEDVIAHRNTRYRELQQQGVPLIEPMIALAKSLARTKAQCGIKLGLASSAPTNEILHNLEQAGLRDAFDLVISGTDDLGDYSDPKGKNKPKPYIYLEAAKRLGVAPDQCLVFEDTNAGVVAAAAAGMVVYAVPNRFTAQQDFSQAAVVVEAISDLLEPNGDDVLFH